MNRIFLLISLAIAAIIAAATATMPILAQERDRLSRECRREIVKLCGIDRREIPACLRSNRNVISDGCRAEVRERVIQQRALQKPLQSESTSQVSRPFRTVIYGPHRRQQIDIYEPKGAVDELPLVLYIHGGAWSFGNHKRVHSMPAFFTRKNYYFAATGYRLLPDTEVEQQAADIGRALQALRGQASALGFDKDRIILIGHSAGAHLAALVGTDPQYAGSAFAAIKGVILLDSAAYDVPTHMESAPPAAWQIFNAAFGSDAERQQALSPITHVGGADAPRWLALYIEQRQETQLQAKRFAARLGEAGAKVRVTAISGSTHSRLNQEIGTVAGAQQTQAIDAFITQTFR